MNARDRSRLLWVLQLGMTALVWIGLIGCSDFVVKRDSAPSGHAHAQANHGGPPAHAPAHGYRRKFQYQYYPEAQVYHDTQSGRYFWLEAGNWRVGVKLPDNIQISVGHGVTVELDTELPYTQHEQVVKKHPYKKKGPAASAHRRR